MTRAAAALGGLLLAAVAALSLNLPLQPRPLVLALPAALLFAGTLARPEAGILATLVLVPLVPVLGNLVHGPGVSLSGIALLACGAALLLRGTTTPREEPAGPTPLHLSLRIAAAAALVGGLAATLAALPAWALPGAVEQLVRELWSVRPEDAAAPLRAAAVHALPLGAFLLVRRLPAGLLARTLALLVAAAAGAAAWGVAEAAGAPRLWPHAAYDPFARFARAVSSLPDHNAAATLFALFLFPAAAFALSGRGRFRAAGALAALLLAAGLLVSGSRAAWLCAGAAAVGVAFSRMRAGRALRTGLAAAGAAALLAAAALVLPGEAGSVVRQRLASLAAPSRTLNAVRYGRVPFWRTGEAMVAAHPFSGVGPGRVAARFAELRPEGFPVLRENVHAWPLQCLAENGVPGGLLLLLPFGFLVPLLARGARSLEGPSAGLVPGLAAAAATGLVSHPFLLLEVQALFWGAAALLDREVARSRVPEEPLRAGPPRALLAGSVALLAVWGLPRLALAPSSELGRFGYGAWDPEGGGRFAWLGPRAAFWLPAAPESLALRTPPEVRTGPSVAVRAGFGAWTRARLEDSEWRALRVAPPRAPSRPVLVEVRASRAFCPAAEGSPDRRLLALQRKISP